MSQSLHLMICWHKVSWGRTRCPVPASPPSWPWKGLRESWCYPDSAAKGQGFSQEQGGPAMEKVQLWPTTAWAVLTHLGGCWLWCKSATASPGWETELCGSDRSLWRVSDQLGWSCFFFTSFRRHETADWRCKAAALQVARNSWSRQKLGYSGTEIRSGDTEQRLPAESRSFQNPHGQLRGNVSPYIVIVVQSLSHVQRFATPLAVFIWLC